MRRPARQRCHEILQTLRFDGVGFLQYFQWYPLDGAVPPSNLQVPSHGRLAQLAPPTLGGDECVRLPYSLLPFACVEDVDERVGMTAMVVDLLEYIFSDDVR